MHPHEEEDTDKICMLHCVETGLSMARYVTGSLDGPAPTSQTDEEDIATTSAVRCCLFRGPIVVV